MVDSAVDDPVDDPPGVAEGGPGWRRGRVLVAAAVVLLLVVIAARVTDGAAVGEVLSIPAAGTVRPDVLANGTPVFVVHTAPLSEGEAPVVDVIQAFTTEVEGPITELVGWCAAAQQFVAAHHGPLYDYRGRRLPSAITGRLPADRVRSGLTALDDLIHRTGEAIAGRETEDEPLRVGGTQLLQAWQDDERPVLAPAVPPVRCRLPEPTWVIAPDSGEGGALPPADLAAARSPVVHHGFLAGDLRVDRGGWQIATGWLVVQPDGATSWCDGEPVVEPDRVGWRARCDDARDDVEVAFDFDPAVVGGLPVVIGGPLAARLQDGAVQRVAVLPGSTWRGSSLRGTEVVTGATAFLDAREQALLVHEAHGGGACRDRWRAVPTPEGSATWIPADLATRTVTPTGGAQIVVDAVTCRALTAVPKP